MRHRYIVCYDVSDPKRLNRVFRKMNGFGDPVQYSVFSCDLSDEEKVLLKAALTKLINQREDRVLIVNVGPADGRGQVSIESLGRGAGPAKRAGAVVV